ncbi:MAG: hypothetical protein HKP41_17720 [Desulfobacterales bacterium]|nr:Smr/MutS family protein [Deltaproteobacteria bacterium]NNK96194.1 hypothetical protein [Desulfobacterales bacterium]
MPLCPTCGNDSGLNAAECQFCGTELDCAECISNTSARLHKIVNLEYGRPTVETALVRLNTEIANARSEQIRVVSLIHGYGSTGKGGKIRIACRKVLAHLVEQGKLRNYIPGETFHKRYGNGKALLRQYAQLGKICVSDFGNPGVTIVVI